ncbi:MAG: peptidoglycan bridge formation glycyltransferase FemA/FemB family protein, partial [Candidatus Liptonbacteria bacterium]|nr:peptidoglycan bridge formation glycyltransferase FemA/FemB family protein [Candidatus Liptonbacteria bacterium]
MNISAAISENKDAWNRFVEKHYPCVGAFMQMWEWGDFQRGLGREVGRYIVSEGDKWIAVFTIAHFKLPFGFSYGYVARGPVLQNAEAATAVFEAMRAWASKKFPRCIFLRLEPPLHSLPSGLEQSLFHIPDYYVQPRYNAAISLSQNDADVSMSFHPSTRSNINRAKKRGVTVAMKEKITPDDYSAFTLMMNETIERNSGKNAYPGDAYFHSLLKTIPPLGGAPKGMPDEATLSIAAFYGYRDNEPVSA